ncbi:MAG: DUF554 domain-containing protein [Eubacteriales bacterium]
MIAGSGTLVNMAAILAGTGVGMLVRRGIPQRVKEVLESATGVSTLLIGLSGCMAGMLSLQQDGTLQTTDTMLLVGCLTLGGMLGVWLRLEERLDGLGQRLAGLVSRGEEHSRTGQAFVTATLLFCVGAMAVVGSLEDGLTGNGSTLYVKAVLDGVLSCVLASTLCPGVGLSALSVGVYQGAMTVLAVWLRPLVTDQAIGQMSMVGSALVLCIGLNLLKISHIRVGYFLPATFLPIVWQFVQKL